MSTQTNIQITASETLNGLDPDFFSEVRENLLTNPDIGRARFRTVTRWNDGTKVSTHVGPWNLDQEKLGTDRYFTDVCDEPEELGGTNIAANPLEKLMQALGSCLAISTAVAASFMGVSLTRYEVTMEADVDLHGFLNAGPVRPGVQAIRPRIIIDGDADETTLREVAERGLRFSVIRDTVENPVTITPEVIIGS